MTTHPHHWILYPTPAGWDANFVQPNVAYYAPQRIEYKSHSVSLIFLGFPYKTKVFHLLLVLDHENCLIHRTI